MSEIYELEIGKNENLAIEECEMIVAEQERAMIVFRTSKQTKYAFNAVKENGEWKTGSVFYSTCEFFNEKRDAVIPGLLNHPSVRLKASLRLKPRSF